MHAFTFVVAKYVFLFFVEKGNNFKIAKSGIDQSIYSLITVIQILFKSTTMLNNDFNKKLAWIYFSWIEEKYKFHRNKSLKITPYEN